MNNKCDCGHDLEKDHGVTDDNRLVRCFKCTCISPGRTEYHNVKVSESDMKQYN